MRWHSVEQIGPDPRWRCAPVRRSTRISGCCDSRSMDLNEPEVLGRGSSHDGGLGQPPFSAVRAALAREVVHSDTNAIQQDGPAAATAGS
jgi:hypothetical protein